MVKAGAEGSQESYYRSLAAVAEAETDLGAKSDIYYDVAKAQFAEKNDAAAKASLAAAMAAARAAGSCEHFGRAVLLLSAQSVGGIGSVDEDLVSRLEEALELHGHIASAQKALLLGRLASELYWSDQASRRAILAREAVDIARGLRDAAVLARSLHEYRVAGGTVDTLDHRVAIATEILELGDEGAEPEMVLEGRIWRIVDFVEFAKLDQAVSDIAQFERTVKELGQETYRWYGPFFHGALAEVSGDFDAAASLYDTAEALAAATSDAVAPLYIVGHRLMIEIERGNAGQVLPVVQAFVDSYPALALWRCALAFVMWHAGERERCEELFAELGADDFGPVRRGGPWLLGLALLAEVCGHVRDKTAARPLYRLLLPFASRNAIGARTLISRGAVDRHLGILAATQGHERLAEKHFLAALDQNSALAQWPSMAQTQLDYARFLINTQQRERAAPLVRAAAGAAKRLLLRRIDREAEELAAELSHATTPVRERESIKSSQAPTRTRSKFEARPSSEVTILFSDIVASTRTARTVGDSAWVELLEAHNVIVRQELAEAGGIEVGTRGDGFMAAFNDPESALRCALRIQRALAHPELLGLDPPLRVRLGIHTGEAIKHGDEFYGIAVNTAARVSAKARADEVLVSSTVRDRLRDHPDFNFGITRRVRFKGLPGIHEVTPVEEP
ncbi:MAG: adenylate/guanylate cyclase domain-containing protein [Actinomycetota bacterium]